MISHVIDDLQNVIDTLQKHPVETHAERAHAMLLALINSYSSHSLNTDAGNAQLDAELLELVNAGKMIDAIKKCRGQLGISLAEAKDYVTRLRSRNATSN